MAIQRFATASVPPSQRLRYWNDIADQVFGGTHVNADEGSFNGTMVTWQLGELEMFRPASTIRRSGAGGANVGFLRDQRAIGW